LEIAVRQGCHHRMIVWCEGKVIMCLTTCGRKKTRLPRFR
jgi:hypothetical protein